MSSLEVWSRLPSLFYFTALFSFITVIIHSFIIAVLLFWHFLPHLCLHFPRRIRFRIYVDYLSSFVKVDILGDVVLTPSSLIFFCSWGHSAWNQCAVLPVLIIQDIVISSWRRYAYFHLFFSPIMKRCEIWHILKLFQDSRMSNGRLTRKYG